MKEKDEKKKEERVMAEFRVFVTDEHGKIIRDTGTKKCKSFVKWFLVGILADLSVHNRTCKNTSGSEFTLEAEGNISGSGRYGLFRGSAGVGNASYGILVGRNDTPPTNEDFKLLEKIGHGDGAGQLEYDKMMFPDINISGGYVKLPLLRTFYNNSGATITVKEIGFVVHVEWNNTECLWLRDVLSPPIDVEQGKTLSVQYIIKTKV